MSTTAEALTLLTETLLRYLVPLAGASGLALALQEAAKKLLSLRGRFHRRALLRWLAQTPAAAPEGTETAALQPLRWVHGVGHYSLHQGADAVLSSAGGTTVRYVDLLALTTGLPRDAIRVDDSGGGRFRGIDRALFELETPKMMAQVQEAADAVINDPDRHESLYAFFTRGCNPAEVRAWREYLREGRAGAEHDALTQKAQAENYGRLRLGVRRQLDGFQSVTMSRWEELNQLWVVVLGAVILFAAQLIAADLSQAGNRDWGLIVLHSLLGGALAPLAKDLVTALSTLKFSR